MKSPLAEDLRRAIPLEGRLVRAHRWVSYREIRTKEVEDGWVLPGQLNRPYPYRVPTKPESFIETEHPGGRVSRHYVDWQLLEIEEGKYFVLAYEGDTVVRITPAENCVIQIGGSIYELHGDE